jgi:hypothetical protein
MISCAIHVLTLYNLCGAGVLHLYLVEYAKIDVKDQNTLSDQKEFTHKEID